MKRRVYIIWFVWIFLIVIFFTSFSQVPGKVGTAVNDDAGRTVVIPAVPRFVVSLSPSNTEILFAIGAGEKVIAVDLYSNYPNDTEALPKINTYPSLDIENIIIYNHYL